jgi:catalase
VPGCRWVDDFESYGPGVRGPFDFAAREVQVCRGELLNFFKRLRFGSGELRGLRLQGKSEKGQGGCKTAHVLIVTCFLKLRRLGWIFRGMRLVLIGVIILCVVAAFGYTGGWLTPDRLTPGRFIDGFEQVNGPHPGFRRNHAKGVCASGSFEGNGQGVRLSKAVVFEPGRVPVIARFALAGGQPYMPDTSANVRSMAVLFALPNGEEWRTGMNNIPVFAVNTPEGFYEQLEASHDSEKMKAFLDRHPESVRAMEEISRRAVSSGFENSTYNSLNAFHFVNAAGASTAVRWSMTPVERFEAATTARGEKNFLFDALIARARKQPLQWHLIVTLGQPGDPTNDATIAWPEGREQVDVGTLTIERVESEDEGRCRDVNFDPLILPSGISPSDDPLLSARSAAYSQSFTRRAGEKKEPSAVQ